MRAAQLGRGPRPRRIAPPPSDSQTLRLTRRVGPSPSGFQGPLGRNASNLRSDGAALRCAGIRPAETILRRCDMLSTRRVTAAALLTLTLVLAWLANLATANSAG